MELSSYLAVGRVLFQMNINAFCNLQEPAPLGLEGVHVSLRESISSAPNARKKMLRIHKRKIPQSYLRPGGRCSKVCLLSLSAYSALSLSLPDPSSASARLTKQF